MARILYSNQVNEIKGSIGGLTFHRNKSGTICKLKPSFRFSNSDAQNVRHSIFSSFILHWTQLTAAAKEAWNTYAAAHTYVDYWGNVKYLSGYNFFMAVNMNRNLCGLSLINTPGTYTGNISVPAFTITKSSTNLNINWSPAFQSNPVPPNVSARIIIFATPPVRSTSLLQKRNLFLIKIVSPGSYSQINIANEWESKFGYSWASVYNSQYTHFVVQVATIMTVSGISSAYTGAVI